jgi:hypothetical protein
LIQGEFEEKMKDVHITLSVVCVERIPSGRREVRGMKRCTRCILPETYPGISFDERGVCSQCRHEASRPERLPLGEEALLEHIRSGPDGPRFDCVVPLSGGKDSTYILYRAARELGLRAIAVNHDAGYQSDIARANVSNACESLGVPLVKSVVDWRVQRRMLRDMLRVSEILGCYTATCTDCEFMLRTLAISVAKRYEVPFILWGSSATESADPAGYEQYRQGRTPWRTLRSKIARLQHMDATPSQMARLGPRVLTYTVRLVGQRRRAGAPLRYIVNPLDSMPFPGHAPAVIHFYDYAEWDPEISTALLGRELGWAHPEGVASRFDCRLHCFVEHRMLRLNGVSHTGILSCRLIREGKLSRDKALAKDQAVSRTVVSECAEIVKDLGLRRDRMPRLL